MALIIQISLSNEESQKLLVRYKGDVDRLKDRMKELILDDE